MSRPRSYALLAAALAVLAPAADAVIAREAAERHATAPDPDPGFARVALVAGLSGVYLGDGWVLTAEHVMNTARRSKNEAHRTRVVLDGKPYELLPDSAVHLQRDGVKADLALVRVAGAPDLPRLRIAERTPAPGTRLFLAGNGPRVEPGRRCWDAKGAPVPAGATGPRCGFAWQTPKEGGPKVNALRWGTNVVASPPALMPGPHGARTQVFATVFDEKGPGDEAQAGVGDSGGPVFVATDGGWRLAGIMVGAGSQVPRAAVFGDRTYVADLSAYRDAIERVLARD